MSYRKGPLHLAIRHEANFLKTKPTEKAASPEIADLLPTETLGKYIQHGLPSIHNLMWPHNRLAHIEVTPEALNTLWQKRNKDKYISTRTHTRAHTPYLRIQIKCVEVYIHPITF